MTEFHLTNHFLVRQLDPVNPIWTKFAMAGHTSLP